MASRNKRSVCLLNRKTNIIAVLLLAILASLIFYAVSYAENKEAESIRISVELITKKENGFKDSYLLSKKLIDLDLFGIITCSSLVKEGADRQVLFSLNETPDCRTNSSKASNSVDIFNNKGEKWVLRYQPGIYKKYKSIYYSSFISLLIIFAGTYIIYFNFRNNELRLIETKEKLIKQVSHDIKSPILSLKELINSQKISSFDRRIIQSSIDRIENMTLSLNDDDIHKSDSACSILATIDELIEEKNSEYKGKVDLSLEVKAPFSFTDMSGFDLKRILSNLINNSVEASRDREAKISVKLEGNDKFNFILIQDNGYGFDQKTSRYLGQNRFSTKSHFRGFGLTGAHDKLKDFGGSLELLKSSHEGSLIQITLPKIEIPNNLSRAIVCRNSNEVKYFDADSEDVTSIPQKCILITSHYSEKISTLAKRSDLNYTLKSLLPYLEFFTPKRIIHVDDDKYIRSHWKKMSVEMGIPIESLGSLEEAFKLTPQDTDVVYIDMELGDTNGLEKSYHVSEYGFKRIFISTGNDQVDLKKYPHIVGLIGKGFPII